MRATFSCIEKKTHLKANGIIKKIAVITHPYEKKRKEGKKVTRFSELKLNAKIFIIGLKLIFFVPHFPVP